MAYSRRKQRIRWSEASDRDLLASVAREDEGAFAELIERKTAPLVRVAWRILGDREEARDVVQLAFLRVWEHRGDYRPRWSPNTWLYRITVNLAIDQLRSRRSQERWTAPMRAHLRRVADSRQSRRLAQLQQREVMEIFRRLAAVLTERQRLVFVLRGIEGLSSRQVAEILGCRPSTVRNHLFTARKRLREELERHYPEYLPRRGRPGGGEEEP